MNTKMVFSVIIAVIFIAAMIVYRETMTFLGIAGAFIGMGGSIRIVWDWFNTKQLEKENKALRNTNAILNFNKNRGMTEDLEVILKQVQIALGMCESLNGPQNILLKETIENIESVIGGGGIKNQPPK